VDRIREIRRTVGEGEIEGSSDHRQRRGRHQEWEIAVAIRPDLPRLHRMQCEVGQAERSSLFANVAFKLSSASLEIGDREFKSTSLHQPVSRLSDIAEN
jgi:hypothetical protein